MFQLRTQDFYSLHPAAFTMTNQRILKEIHRE